MTSPPNRKPRGSAKDAKGKGTGGQFAHKPVADDPDVELEIDLSVNGGVWWENDIENVTQRLLQELGYSPNEIPNFQENYHLLTKREQSLIFALDEIRGGGVPLLLGPVGSGKTEGAISIANAMGADYYMVTLSELDDPSALTGRAVPGDITKQLPEVTIAPAPWLRAAIQEEELAKEEGRLPTPMVLHMDEITAAGPGVNEAVLGLICNRTVGGYKVPDHVSFIASGNRPQDSSHARKLSEALANRFSQVNIGLPTADEWHQYTFKDKPKHSNTENWIESATTFPEFVKEHPYVWDTGTDQHKTLRAEEVVFPTPRTMNQAQRRVAELMTRYKLNGIDRTHPSIVMALESKIGKTATQKFFAFVADQSFPDHKKWFDDPNGNSPESPKNINLVGRGVTQAQVTLDRMVASLSSPPDPPVGNAQETNKYQLEKYAKMIEAIVIINERSGTPRLCHGAFEKLQSGAKALYKAPEYDASGNERHIGDPYTRLKAHNPKLMQKLIDQYMEPDPDSGESYQDKIDTLRTATTKRQRNVDAGF